MKLPSEATTTKDLGQKFEQIDGTRGTVSFYIVLELVCRFIFGDKAAAGRFT